MRIAICDDSKLDLDMICDLMRNCFAETPLHPELVPYIRSQPLLDDVQDGTWFDVVFLDIMMPGDLGIDVARNLRKVGFDGDIVFLTATKDFAVDSYDVNATGYLLKPVSVEKLNMVLARLIKNITVGVYSIRQRANLIQVPLSEILFVESRNNRCILHRAGGQEYTIYKKLDEIQEELQDKRFLRCHQSYLVNMDHIRSADSRAFILSTGENVYIRTRQVRAMRDAYLAYSNERRPGWRQS